MTHTEFAQQSATLSARMVSLDAKTRAAAAFEIGEMLKTLPKVIANDPNCAGEIAALRTLLAKWFAE